MAWYCARCGQAANVAGACARDGEALSRVSSHDLLGRKLGEYTVLAALGGGSFGTVYRAVHERSGMVAAIKLLHRPIDDSESQRVLVEARAAAMLDHPNVVQVYDLAVTSDRRPYIVMQYLEGRPLAHVMEQRLPVAFAVALANDILAGIGAAHARGIIHRDLKPDNVFVAAGRAIVVDFGLAKLVADPRSPNLTVTGEAIGTPHFMAPEQIRGKAVDGRADLYAVGCVLFEMLAGRPLFEGSTTFALFDAHLHQAPRSIATLRPDVPAAVDAAIARALAKDPAARFADASAMQRALRSTEAAVGRKRWPVAVAGGVLGLAAIATVAAFTDGGASKLGDASPAGSSQLLASAVTAKPRSVVVPPPDPDEPPLDPALETTLRSVADNFERGRYKRPDVVRLRCAMEELRVTSPARAPQAIRAYNRRFLQLLREQAPDLDPGIECSKGAPVRAGWAPRIALAPALPDELPLDDSIEKILRAMHEQLEDGHYGRSIALRLACDFERQRAQLKRELGVPRMVRGYFRRAELLLHGYFPDLAPATECKDPG